MASPSVQRSRLLPDDIRDEITRGAETPDFFSSRPTKELQTVLRETPTRPLAALINTGETIVDLEHRRIIRDVFWKGSFARDTLLGWEERVRTALLGPRGLEAGAVYAGGSFWKRFDRIVDGVAHGHVVNYEVSALPGKPVVEEVEYPDDHRRYFAKGDRVLLLRYTNEPYRIVYDAIKVIDDQNAIGVMHLGTFPRGLEFATFVMARHNYPFELMSIEDHRLLFEDGRSRRPDARELRGDWTGRLIPVTPQEPGLAKSSPGAFRLWFGQDDSESRLEGRGALGLSLGTADGDVAETQARVAALADWQQDLRIIGDTLLGGWRTASLSPQRHPWLARFVEDGASGPVCYFVVSRVGK